MWGSLSPCQGGEPEMLPSPLGERGINRVPSREYSKSLGNGEWGEPLKCQEISPENGPERHFLEILN